MTKRINNKKTFNKQSWTQRFETRTARWAKKRHANGKTDSIPHKITGRRTYIIPTRFGFVFSLATFVLLLGAMNYSNSLAFFLSFLLAGVLFVSMHLTNFNLSHIETQPLVSEPVFAGEQAKIKIGLVHATEFRPQIELRNTASLEHASIIAKKNISNAQIHAVINTPSEHRGYVSLDHYLLSTRYPLNLFHAWSIVFHPVKCLVYPRPSTVAPDIYGSENSTDSIKNSPKTGHDDFAGLREYQWQDSPQHIAWKTYATRNELMVKQFNENIANSYWLDYDRLKSPDIETRLSQLCRLVIDADNNQHHYGLRLKNISIAPNHGAAHRHECLKALALFDLDNTANHLVNKNSNSANEVKHD